MGLLYESPPRGGIQVMGGTSHVVELPFPSRSRVTKIVVEQTDGVVVGFDVDLFNHAGAARGNNQSESDGAETGRIGAHCYRVANTLHGSGGLLAYFSEESTGGAGWAFVSQDPPDATRGNRGNQRTLYVRISAQGSGAKTFSLCVGGESSVD